VAPNQQRESCYGQQQQKVLSGQHCALYSAFLLTGFYYIPDETHHDSSMQSPAKQAFVSARSVGLMPQPMTWMPHEVPGSGADMEKIPLLSVQFHGALASSWSRERQQKKQLRSYNCKAFGPAVLELVSGPYEFIIPVKVDVEQIGRERAAMKCLRQSFCSLQ
jgi:hypothetical protein